MWFIRLFLSPLLDFLGLNSVSAIVERMLIVTYPIFVIIISSIIQKKMISYGNLITIVVIYFGIFMTIGGGDFSLLQANLKGSFLILLSSFVYAIYFIMSGNLVHKLGSVKLNAYGMITASFFMFLYLAYKKIAGYSLHLFGFSNTVYVMFILIAVISTVLSFVLITEGIKKIGAERAAIISMLGPILTILLGRLFLKEHLTVTQWCGCLIIFLAITSLELYNIHIKKNKNLINSKEG
ncbi:DMT family transporter [Calidifontibacillus erzurumensis]|uniref:DMT family transporter n=1 Tax=Calidifontibacillus erzurumensis TaxID=2741433 RepID=UPI0035B5412E